MYGIEFLGISPKFFATVMGRRQLVRARGCLLNFNVGVILKKGNIYGQAQVHLG